MSTRILETRTDINTVADLIGYLSALPDPSAAFVNLDQGLAALPLQVSLIEQRLTDGSIVHDIAINTH